MTGDALLVAVVLAALLFDFTNGFHDTANAVATAISTRALSPRAAVALAAVMNFAGALLSTEVAVTVAQDIVVPGAITLDILLAALIGALVWNLATWYAGLPSSSSHALIGGLVGAALAGAGTDAVQWSLLISQVAVPALTSPVAGFAVAFAIMVVLYRIALRARASTMRRFFRHGQIVSASAVALAHGTNDAQKTMGVITLALITSGETDSFAVPTWVIISAALALSAGTFVGGWRIMRTLGQRVFELDPPHGFAAETASAGVLYTTAALGLPVSTTHVISGAIVGVGATRRVSAVRWGVARSIAIAWLVTLPAAALVAALVSPVLAGL